MHPVLKTLHWLPLEHNPVSKTATLVYKFLNTGFLNTLVPIGFLNTLVHIWFHIAVVITPEVVVVMKISWLFKGFSHPFISL